MEAIGFTFLRIYFYLLAPSLNGVYGKYSQQRSSSQIQEETADSSDDESLVEPRLKRVFSSSLDHKKTWLAISTALCTCKPSTFCSSMSFCWTFCRRIPTCESGGSDLRWKSSCQFPLVLQQKDGESLCCNHFGLLLGILQLKLLDNCTFLKSDYFKVVMSSINLFQVSSGGGSESATEIHLKVENRSPAFHRH